MIGALLYLPFGKFFHIFQRPAQLGVKLYQTAGERDEGAHCARCGLRFASRMQIDDLNHVLPQLGFDYRIAGSGRHMAGAVSRVQANFVRHSATQNQGGSTWLNRQCPSRS